jgi:hypothetical protein
MGRRVWIKHEEKTRRHQPRAATRIKGKYVDAVMSAPSVI